MLGDSFTDIANRIRASTWGIVPRIVLNFRTNSYLRFSGGRLGRRSTGSETRDGNFKISQPNGYKEEGDRQKENAEVTPGGYNGHNAANAHKTPPDCQDLIPVR